MRYKIFQVLLILFLFPDTPQKGKIRAIDGSNIQVSWIENEVTKAKKIESSSILEIIPKKGFRSFIKWCLTILKSLRIPGSLKIFAVAVCGFTILVVIYNMKNHLYEVRYDLLLVLLRLSTFFDYFDCRQSSLKKTQSQLCIDSSDFCIHMH